MGAGIWESQSVGSLGGVIGVPVQGCGQVEM